MTSPSRPMIRPWPRAAGQGRMVGKLRNIKVWELPLAIERVTDIFDRCCGFLGSHKQPLETLNVRPTLEGLEKDWRMIQDIHNAFQAT
jgi:hypothetical protein